jgi:hypothetical protein
MKKLIIVGICLFTSYGINAQEINTGNNNEVKTLLSNGGGVTGGFFMLQPKMTYFNDQTALVGGMSMAMVLGHQFNMGLAINFLMTGVDTYYTEYFIGPYTALADLNFTYGGMLLEPVFFNKSAIHFTTPVVVGPGVASLTNDSYFNSFASDIIWVVEPGLNLELNVTKVLRFILGGSYRFVFDTQLEGTDNQSLSDFAFSAGFKIGWY